MRILIVGLMALLLVSMLSFAVMAEENENTDVSGEQPNLISENTNVSEETGTVDSATSDEINDELNGTASNWDFTKERVKLWFTFNQEKKAEIELKLAKLELIRAKVAAKNNNTEAMEKALDAHNRLLEKVQTRMNSIDGKSTKEGIQGAAAKLVGLERAIQVHEARIAKLKEILASENLTAEQTEKVQAKIEKAEDNTAHLKEVQAAKQEKVKTRLMAVANMTEEEANEKIQELEDAQNLSAVKKMVAEVKAVRAENAAEVISGVIEKLQENQN